MRSFTEWKTRAEAQAYVKENVRPDGRMGCWLWQGYVEPDGYARIQLRHQDMGNVAAHRYSYWAFNGHLSQASVVHHTCARRHCVNPAHLQETTHHANTAEMLGRRAYEARIAVLEGRVAELETILRDGAAA